MKAVRELSLEAIKQITEMERTCEQRKTEAVQQARRTVADAEKAGQAALESRRAEAEAQVKTILAEAEAGAAVQAKAVQDETIRSCNELKAAAQQHLDEAAQLIVRRVVKLA